MEFTMKLNWGKVPLDLLCPNCQQKIDRYENLLDNEWKFILQKTPDPLQDYHKCPQCQQMWAILKPHTDET